MSASPVARLSPNEYLAIERGAEFKSEYFDGQMFAMSGGSHAHNVISSNVHALLWNLSRGKGCYPIGSDQRLRVSPDGLYTYPDTVVVCGEAQFADNQKDTLLNPVLIVRCYPNLQKPTIGDSSSLNTASWNHCGSTCWYLKRSREWNCSNAKAPGGH